MFYVGNIIPFMYGSCGLVGGYQGSEGTYCHHLQKKVKMDAYVPPKC
jgi:hypothetical protein